MFFVHGNERCRNLLKCAPSGFLDEAPECRRRPTPSCHALWTGLPTKWAVILPSHLHSLDTVWGLLSASNWPELCGSSTECNPRSCLFPGEQLHIWPEDNGPFTICRLKPLSRRCAIWTVRRLKCWTMLS